MTNTGGIPAGPYLDACTMGSPARCWRLPVRLEHTPSPGSRVGELLCYVMLLLCYAMMPSTMIRTTRHDASRQVAFASSAAGDQLPMRSTASLADPWLSIPPMMQNPERYDRDYDYDYGYDRNRNRNYVTLRYVMVSGLILLVTQQLWC